MMEISYCENEWKKGKKRTLFKRLTDVIFGELIMIWVYCLWRKRRVRLAAFEQVHCIRHSANRLVQSLFGYNVNDSGCSNQAGRPNWISECEDVPFILKSLTFYWAIQENLLFKAEGKKNFFHSVARILHFLHRILLEIWTIISNKMDNSIEI